MTDKTAGLSIFKMRILELWLSTKMVLVITIPGPGGAGS
jgi:hypothetical protein